MTVVGIVIAVSAVASAAVPSLPHRTPAQLLAEIGQGAGKPLGPLTATVQQTANLGLPQLPSVGQAGGALGLASGTQSISIWYRDPQHIRIAEPVQAGESDLRLNGRTLWLWNSKTQTATRLALPAHFTGLPNQAGNGAAPLRRALGSSGARAGTLPDSPLAAANQVLKAVGPSTVVGVQSNVYVANRAAYQLSLVPRSSNSLVGKILIAVDASRRIPVRVEVFGRGSAGLVYSIGFSSLTFGKPAAANFSFTPPRGATVKKQAIPSNLNSLFGPAGPGPAGVSGGSFKVGGVSSGTAGFAGPATVGMPVTSGPPIPKRALAAIKAQFANTLPKSMTKAQRAKAIRSFDQQITAAAGSTVNNGGGFFNAGPAASVGQQAGAPKVIGKDWLSVIATPANPQVAAAVHQLLAKPTSGQQIVQSGSSLPVSSSQAYSSTLTVTPGPAGPYLAPLRALLLASSPVRGSWGSGRLLQTKLLSVLITSKGQILAGAVSPTVLYADVAADAG